MSVLLLLSFVCGSSLGLILLPYTNHLIATDKRNDSDEEYEDEDVD